MTDPGPYHVLMGSTNNKTSNEQQIRLEAARKQFLRRQSSLQTDYVAKRLKALKSASMKIPNNNCEGGESDITASDVLWLGVYNWERATVSFCEKLAEEDIHLKTKGALADGLVTRFVGFVATHCHDVASRALTLAILDRTLQEDEHDAVHEIDSPRSSPKSNLSNRKRLNPEDNDSDNSYNKRQKIEIKDEHGSIPDKPESGETVAYASPQPRRSRISTFLASGGLRLLNQWLIDATTPVQIPTSTNSGSGAKQVASRQMNETPSPTSAILVVLLEFLSNIPFDSFLFSIVKSSKIDRHISKLRKQVKQELDNSSVEVRLQTNPYWGSLDARTVKSALDQLKESWKNAYDSIGKVVAKESSSKGDDVATYLRDSSDPFAVFKDMLSDRLQVLENPIEGDKPEWLAQLEARATKANAKKKRKGLSTADLEKLEREKERAAMLKEDLEQAQAYRRQCQAKLRELEKKQLEEKQGPVRQTDSRSKVRWKDGMGPTATSRRRDMLEQVFSIPGRDNSANAAAESSMLDGLDGTE